MRYITTQKDLELFKNTVRLESDAERIAAFAAMSPDQKKAFQEYVENGAKINALNKEKHDLNNELNKEIEKGAKRKISKP